MLHVHVPRSLTGCHPGGPPTALEVREEIPTCRWSLAASSSSEKRTWGGRRAGKLACFTFWFAEAVFSSSQCSLVCALALAAHSVASYSGRASGRVLTVRFGEVVPLGEVGPSLLEVPLPPAAPPSSPAAAVRPAAEAGVPGGEVMAARTAEVMAAAGPLPALPMGQDLMGAAAAPAAPAPTPPPAEVGSRPPPCFCSLSARIAARAASWHSLVVQG